MEQRVKTLEQEVKILKNQIQKTLLDIQEQVLLHYHPALRPEESAANGFAAADSARLTDNEYTNIPLTRPNSPLVRQVSLADLRTTPEPAAPGKTNPTTNPQDLHSFSALSAWVAQSVGQVGGERTRKILALRAAATGIPHQIHNTLNELITLYSEDEEMRQGAAAELLQQLNHLLDNESGESLGNS